MPVVKIEMWKGLKSGEKEKLIGAIYKAFDTMPQIPKDAITVIINETERENWGLFGGQATKTMPIKQ